jgi:hypothetical protein
MAGQAAGLSEPRSAPFIALYILFAHTVCFVCFRQRGAFVSETLEQTVSSWSDLCDFIAVYIINFTSASLRSVHPGCREKMLSLLQSVEAPCNVS